MPMMQNVGDEHLGPGNRVPAESSDECEVLSGLHFVSRNFTVESFAKAAT
jgi:hypothetical protein